MDSMFDFVDYYLDHVVFVFLGEPHVYGIFF